MAKEHTMKTAEERTIGPNWRKLLVALLVGGLALTAGISLVLLKGLGVDRLGASWWMVVAVVGGVVGCCVGALVLAAIVGQRPRVEMGPNGFVVRRVFGSYSRSWDDVEGEFEVIKIGHGKAVGYRLTEEHKRWAGIKPTSLFAGKDEAMSGELRVTMEELAALLNEHKRRAASS
jgi:hypothetical protein